MRLRLNGTFQYYNRGFSRSRNRVRDVEYFLTNTINFLPCFGLRQRGNGVQPVVLTMRLGSENHCLYCLSFMIK